MWVINQRRIYCDCGCLLLLEVWSCNPLSLPWLCVALSSRAAQRAAQLSRIENTFSALPLLMLRGIDSVNNSIHHEWQNGGEKKHLNSWVPLWSEEFVAKLMWKISSVNCSSTANASWLLSSVHSVSLPSANSMLGCPSDFIKNVSGLEKVDIYLCGLLEAAWAVGFEFIK